MTPAPATGRTADENEMRAGIVAALNAAFRGFSFPGGRWSEGYGSEMAADAILSGPLAPILQEAATARKERDEALKLARMGFREKHVFLALGQAEAIADRKAAEAEAAHLRAENANLRDRVREAEKGGVASRLWGKTHAQIAEEICGAKLPGQAEGLVARLIEDARAFERDALTPGTQEAGDGR